MRLTSTLARLACSGALLGIGAVACDSVLDIDDPVIRPGDAGAAGEPSNGGSTGNTGNTSSGGTHITPQGGEAGESGKRPISGGGSSPLTPEGGAGGEAGAPPLPECEEDAVQCAGADLKTPQICKDGHWTQNTLQSDGDCAVLCAAGECTECEGDAKRCSVCAEGDANCSTNRPQKCVGGHWQAEADKCAHYCNAGECAMPPSCPAIAGERNNCSGESCCTSLRVEGGSFSRDYDAYSMITEPGQYPATISPFLLDKFEVTVGRMRSFLNAYSQITLKDGDGRSNHIPNDTGWSSTYTLPDTANHVIDVLKTEGPTWNDATNLNNDLPINSVNFNIAYAFCIWDGGRLPTVAEWNFAATGGNEQRPYPWKPLAEDPQITTSYATYNAASPTAVGSKPLGNGRWGQADLAGNVGEWTLDFNGEYAEVCVDCLNITPSSERTQRGGYYAYSVEDFLLANLPGSLEPDKAISTIGFRCARDLE
jgi:formylglycine-generating enzyme required for sulfatase activity